jgi:hypothetical protein
MINNEILTFIKERLAQGSTHEQITDMLVTHGGWDNKDVEEAFDTLDISGSSMVSVMNDMSKASKKIEEEEEQVEQKTPEPETKVNTVLSNAFPITSPFTPIQVKKQEEHEVSNHVEAVATGTGTTVELHASPVTSLPSVPTTEPKDTPALVQVQTPQVLTLSPITETKKDVSPDSVGTPTSAISFPPAKTSVLNPVTNTSPSLSELLAKRSSPTSPPQNSLPTTAPASAAETGAVSPSSKNPLSVTESPGFSTIAKLKETKSLEPTKAAPFASARLGTFQPKPVGNAPTAFSSFSKPPALAVGSGITPSSASSEARSLSDIRARFASGSNTPPASPGSVTGKTLEPSAVSSIPVLKTGPSEPPATMGKITVLNPIKPEMSPHAQSGMIPSPGMVSSSPTLTPVLAPKVLEPVPQSASSFARDQKLPTGIPSLQHNQAAARNVPPPRGRKLLGTVMFLVGLIIGATIMHAYLNEYFDPFVDWAKTNIPALSGPSS